MHNTWASWPVQYAGPWSLTIHALAQAAKWCRNLEHFSCCTNSHMHLLSGLTFFQICFDATQLEMCHCIALTSEHMQICAVLT